MRSTLIQPKVSYLPYTRNRSRDERVGRLTPRSVLVESSSGNLGVALSMIAASKG
jgi:N-(2-amino-2-carboxyethyl)-L-glutamate synthase